VLHNYSSSQWEDISVEGKQGHTTLNTHGIVKVASRCFHIIYSLTPLLECKYVAWLLTQMEIACHNYAILIKKILSHLGFQFAVPFLPILSATLA
jgi:hypothetical protein